MRVPIYPRMEILSTGQRISIIETIGYLKTCQSDVKGISRCSHVVVLVHTNVMEPSKSVQPYLQSRLVVGCS
jgi:hypothetical protein